MANQPARQIGKAKLLGLVKAIDNTNSRMATERQALGAKFESAATSDNFNAKALRVLLPLLKLEPGPQAHLWRTINLYAAHLDIGTQGDLEDVINDSEARDGDNGDGTEEDGGEGNEDDARDLAEDAAGDGDGDPVDSLLANMDTPALGRFRTAMNAATTVEAVNKGLERFTEDHPASADDALEIAQERLAAINAEQGDGEDLRPDSLRNAAAVEAEQVVEGAKKTPRKKSTRDNIRRPESPAAEAARSNGIGDDFGKANSTVVH